MLSTTYAGYPDKQTMRDELEDLIGTEDEDHERQCAKCGAHYPVHEGDYITRLCPDCSTRAVCGEEAQ